MNAVMALFRFGFAALLGYLSAEPLTHGLYIVLGHFYPYAAMPSWDENAHNILLWTVGLVAMSFWHNGLPLLPSILLAAIAAYLTFQLLQGPLAWLFGTEYTTPGSTRIVITGLAGLITYTFWFGIFQRIPGLQLNLF